MDIDPLGSIVVELGNLYMDIDLLGSIVVQLGKPLDEYGPVRIHCGGVRDTFTWILTC